MKEVFDFSKSAGSMMEQVGSFVPKNKLAVMLKEDEERMRQASIEAASNPPLEAITHAKLDSIVENTSSLPEQVDQLKNVVANQNEQIDLAKKEIQSLKTIAATNEESIKRLSEINESLKEQIQVAVSDSESAKKDAMFSQIAAILSILFSAITLFT